MPVIAAVQTILTLLPGFINAGLSVISLINATGAAVKSAQDEGRADLTDAEWNALDTQVADLRKQAAA